MAAGICLENAPELRTFSSFLSSVGVEREEERQVLQQLSPRPLLPRLPFVTSIRLSSSFLPLR